MSPVEKKILEAMNYYRSLHNSPPLEWSHELTPNPVNRDECGTINTDVGTNGVFGVFSKFSKPQSAVVGVYIGIESMPVSGKRDGHNSASSQMLWDTATKVGCRFDSNENCSVIEHGGNLYNSFLTCMFDVNADGGNADEHVGPMVSGIDIYVPEEVNIFLTSERLFNEIDDGSGSGSISP